MHALRARSDLAGQRGVGGLNVFAADGAVVWARFDVQGVAPVQQQEHRLQQVVAVCAAANDVQKQVDLGRGWQVVERAHGR